jgi:hypothetical protein
MRAKIIIPMVVCLLLLGGCAGSKDANNSNKTETMDQNKVYGINEEWVVDGEWKLKITDVKVTTKRNQFSKDTPVEVVVVNYTYENLGYKGDMQELFMVPDTVVDGAKKVVSTYPVGVDKYPKETPEGASCDAQEAYGLTVASDKIQITFEKYGSKVKKNYKATFEVPITK